MGQLVNDDLSNRIFAAVFFASIIYQLIGFHKIRWSFGNGMLFIDIFAEIGYTTVIDSTLLRAAICSAYGATVSYAKELMHGKQSEIRIDNSAKLFQNLPGTILAARYHSLAAIPETMPECLKVIGQTADGEIMAAAHREYPIYGVQFHPESILTPDGMQMIKNFLSI